MKLDDCDKGIGLINDKKVEGLKVNQEFLDDP